MRQKFLRVAALALTLLTLTSLLAGCNVKTKPVVTETLQMNNTIYTIGVPSGATAVNAVESDLPKAKMKYYSSLPDAYLAVQQGKVDAFAFDRYLLGFAIANGLDGVKILPGDVGATDDVAIGISRKSDIPDLQQKINNCLSELRSNGTLDDMFERWVVNADDTMPDIPKPKNPTMTLKVGTSGLVQPFSYYKGNELTGYDLELAARLALYLNAKIEIKVYDYDGFPSAAESGAIDCILANLNATPERRETMDFSTPLFQTQTALLVKDDGEVENKENQMPESDTQRVSVESARIGVMEGSTNEVYAEELYPKATLMNFKNYIDSTAALDAGKLDYAMMDYTSALRFIRSNHNLEIASDALTEEKVCLGISKNQPQLAQKVSTVVDKYIADGTMDEIISHWIKPDGSDYNVVKTPKLTDAPKVKVAIIASREPTTFLLNGEYAGLDVELIDRVLYELGYQAEYQDMELGAVIAAVESNKADMTLGMYSTPEREEKLLFTSPYFTNPQVLLARRISEKVSTAGIALETGRYGITSVVAQDYLSKKYPNAKLSMYTSAADAMLALQSGKLDYVMTSRSTAFYMMKQDTSLKVAQDGVVDEACYIAVSKQRGDLKEKVDALLTQFKGDGTLDELNGRWVGEGPDYYRTKDIPEAEGKNGILKVGISPDAPPICFVQDGESVGINVELIQRIARELDMTVEFVTMDFDSLLPSIQSNKVDLAISDINATDERRKLVDFTQPYFSNPQVLVAQQKTLPNADVPQYMHLNQLSGKVVASQTGTIYDGLIDSKIPDVTYSYFNNRADMLAALENGKVEAVPADEPVAKLAVAKNSAFTILPERIVEDHYGIALQKDSSLTDQVNQAIAQLKADGTLAAMKEKWTGDDESLKTLPQLKYLGMNGTLRVAHDISGEPMEYVGVGGKSLGYDLELILRIGEILDYKVEFTNVDFSGLIPMLQSGKADMAVGCISITDERKKTVDMSEPYYDGGLYFIVRKVTESAPATFTQTKESLGDSLKASFTRTFLTENRWKLVLEGMKVTVLISICSGILGSLMGFGICMLRRSKKRFVYLPVAAFIRIIQGTPIVVLLMILYYIIFGKLDISAILVAIMGFAVNFGVYVSEMMRTGIDAVDKGQIEAAYALGFTKVKTFWKITFPQAARHFLPVFKGEFISMVKMTSVVGYIAIQDLTKVSDIIRSRTLEAFFPLIATAVIYFIVANILTILLMRLEIRLDPKRRKRAVKGVVMK